MAGATLTISSKNYSSWSLRGWLLCRMAGLEFDEKRVDLDDPEMRQELLLLSPSVLVPRLTHNTVTVWDTLAIAEYLSEITPDAGLLPDDLAASPLPRGFRPDRSHRRSELPMNLKAHASFNFHGARPDERSRRPTGARHRGGPYLFGESASQMPWPRRCAAAGPTPSISIQRFAYCGRILDWPLMRMDRKRHGRARRNHRTGSEFRALADAWIAKVPGDAKPWSRLLKWSEIDKSANTHFRRPTFASWLGVSRHPAAWRKLGGGDRSVLSSCTIKSPLPYF
jgi:glutathione S-transferase